MKLSLIKKISIVAVIVALAVMCLGLIFFFKKTTRELTITVPRGAGAGAIAVELKNLGVTRTTIAPRFLMIFLGVTDKFQFGTFTIPAGTTIVDLLRGLTATQYQDREVTLIEGWNVRDLTRYLIANGFGTSAGIKALIGEAAKDLRVTKGVAGRDWSGEFPVLKSKPSYVSLEGFIFPDTYRVSLNATAEEVIRKALQNFDKKLTPDLRAEITRQKKNIFEIITMASILEREVKTPEDKALVADIFWRRIARGMGLEADSTVNYATGKSLPGVTYDDLKINSSWNTYKYRGLPLGPISNPGLDSIRAAIYPKSNSYWYFLTKPDGGVVYSKTYNEHINNKNKFLK